MKKLNVYTQNTQKDLQQPDELKFKVGDKIQRTFKLFNYTDVGTILSFKYTEDMCDGVIEEINVSLGDGAGKVTTLLGTKYKNDAYEKFNNVEIIKTI